jgi:Zn-dependent protease with chaperone function
VPLATREFVHPEDKAALDELRSIPLFTECLQAVMKVLPERLLHGTNMAQKIRLGPDQLPDLWRHLPEVCRALDIPEPELFLEMDPRPNAYTYGDKTPFVTITSGLVDSLEDHELRAVIAHECGHIVLQHTLYHTMAWILVMVGPSVLGPLSAAAGPVVMALRYWLRRSELSADRASAAVMGSVGPVVETLIRLAGGPKSVTAKVDIGKYAEQAEEYDKLNESTWDKLLQNLVATQQTHPLLAVRTREIIAWGQTDHFQRIARRVSGAPAAEGECPNCGRDVERAWRFCRHCGTGSLN